MELSVVFLKVSREVFLLYFVFVHHHLFFLPYFSSSCSFHSLLRFSIFLLRMHECVYCVYCQKCMSMNGSFFFFCDLFFTCTPRKIGLEKHTKEKMAIKAIRLDNPSSFYHEVKMNTLAQGNGSIVKFRESFIVDGIGYLIHDLCCYGEVFHHIVPHTGLDQRELIGPFFAQLIDALAYLHSHGVCHLDVKPEVRACRSKLLLARIPYLW